MLLNPKNLKTTKKPKVNFIVADIAVRLPTRRFAPVAVDIYNIDYIGNQQKNALIVRFLRNIYLFKRRL